MNTNPSINASAFSTYCSDTKAQGVSPLPAIERYRSLRIAKIYGAALGIGLSFYIISGKYGLVSAYQRIHYYDHLLLLEEVDSLVQLMTQQMKDYKLKSLVYFTAPLSSDENLIPYKYALERSCIKTEIPYLIIELDDNFLHAAGGDSYD